jgi:hypothetical protein
MSSTEDRYVNSSRPWSSWVVLLGMSLTAADAACFAADNPYLPAPAPTAPVVRKAAPARPQPVKAERSLLDALSSALQGADDRNNRNRQALRADDPEIRALETQLRPQFQQFLYVELAFLRRVCKVDAKAFVEVAKGAKPGLRATVRQYAVAQAALMRQRNDERSETVDPHTLVQRLLTPLVEAKLGAEQAQHYRQECEKRAEGRKRAVVLNLVATLDDRLVLTAEQRAKLVESLSSDYQSGWEQFSRIFAANAQYLPSIRDDVIVPLLNERQKGVWRQATKVSPNTFWGFQFGRGGMAGGAGGIPEIARIVEEAQDDR